MFLRQSQIRTKQAQDKMTTIKITKKDMVEAITEYLSAQGKRMTNLKKASEEKLQELVEKYEINIQEFAKNRKEEMKKQRAIDKKAKEKRDEEQRERDRKWGERIDEIRKLSSMLDLDIFRLRESIQKQLLDTIRYRNNKAEIDAENESNKKMCDREFKCFQREQSLGAIKLLERVDDFTISVNCVNVSYGYKVGVETHEFYINWSKGYSDIDLFGNVYDAGLLPTIAEQYKLYINGKANWIVEKQNRRRIRVDTWGETQTIMPNEVFKFISDKLTDKQIAEINEFIMKRDNDTREGVLKLLCEKCMLIECCCEADRLQVIKDDERARAEGYIEIGGRWVKK